MSLIHGLIAKSTTVLCEQSISDQQGGFKQSAQITILSKIPPNDSRLTYVWHDKLIHYASSGGFVYLVVADDAVGRRVPFAFLADLEARFKDRYSLADVESSHLALQDDFGPELADLMRKYTDEPPNDPLKQAQADLNNVKDIMVQNIDSILSRGERIELLVDKTDAMAGQARAFRRGARGVRRQMWWKNTRVVALSGVVGVLFFYLILAQFCGAALKCGS